MSEPVFSGWVFLITPGVGGSAGTSGQRKKLLLPRFMALAESTVVMYRQDPQRFPGEGPTFKGLIGPNTLVREMGRKVLGDGQVLHMFGLANKAAPGTRNFEIGCASAEAALEWVTVLQEAAGGKKVGHGHRETKLAAAAGGAKEADARSKGRRGRTFLRMIAMGKGLTGPRPVPVAEAEGVEVGEDAVESTHWRLVRLVNGLRIFEAEQSPDEASRSRVLKAEGVVEAEPTQIFDTIMSSSDAVRRQWDPLTVDVRVVETLDGFTEILQGLVQAPGKGGKVCYRELLCKRAWRRNQDGSYVISLVPISPERLSEVPPLNQASWHWDIVALRGGAAPSVRGHPSVQRCPRSAAPPSSLVRFVVEVPLSSAGSSSSARGPLSRQASRRKVVLPIFGGGGAEWHLTLRGTDVDEPLEELADGLPYASMTRIAGLREYFAAMTMPDVDAPSGLEGGCGGSAEGEGEEEGGVDGESEGVLAVMHDLSLSMGEDAAGGDEFFDALENEAQDAGPRPAEKSASAQKNWQTLKWATQFGTLIHSLSEVGNEELWYVRRELLHHLAPADMLLLGQQLRAQESLPQLLAAEAASGGGEVRNAWCSLGGSDFCVRGTNYLRDHIKVPAEDPLLHLLAMDWLTDSKRIDHAASLPGSIGQSDAAKTAPFLFIVNLQVPGPPFYSLVAYFAADRPLRSHPQSLLHRFATAEDSSFRNSRLKLIPRMAEGNWMVKRAVGSKACILGRALQCAWFRGGNYLEMDCDIGSSSVARSVIGLVISSVSSLVVDLALLIEAQEKPELPEYLLGAFRAIRLDTNKAAKPPSATC